MSGVFKFKTVVSDHTPPASLPKRERTRPLAVVIADEQPRWQRHTFIGICFLILLLLPFLNHRLNYQRQAHISNLSTSASNQINLQTLNRDIQTIYQKAVIRSAQMESENSRFAPQVHDADIREWENSALFGQDATVDTRQEQSVNKVYTDLTTGEKQVSDHSFDERLSAILATRQWVNEYDNTQRDLYVQQVLENARRAGYEIKLNNNLEIVDVKQTAIPQKAYEVGRTPDGVPGGSR